MGVINRLEEVTDQIECILLTPLHTSLSDLISLKAKIEKTQKFVISDDLLFSKEKKIIRPRGARGTDIPVKEKKYLDDPKNIKNVYFLKDTNFDRGYFRRLYPDINIRKNIENADVIIYDDTSIFSNDKVPPLYKIYTIDNIKYAVSANSSIPNFYFGLRSNSNMRLFPTWDTQNSKIISNICQHGSFNFNGRNYIYIRDFVDNPYIEKIKASNKLFLHAEEFFSVRQSSSRSDNMKYEDLLSLAYQITSSDKNASLAACETLIQYNQHKYLPVQSFLFYMSSCDVHYSNFSDSKKFQIFKKTYLDKMQYPLSAYRDCPMNDINNSNGKMMAYAKLIMWTTRWTNNCFSEYDVSDIVKFLYSGEFFNVFGPKNKSSTNGQIISVKSAPIAISGGGMTSGRSHVLKVEKTNDYIVNADSIIWSIDDEQFKNPNYFSDNNYTVSVNDTVSDTVSDHSEANIEMEFGI